MTIPMIQELEQNIVQWAKDRGIFEHTTPIDQLVKTIEEFGELARAVNKQNHDALVDAYGDILVTLIVGMHSAGFDYQQCYDSYETLDADNDEKINVCYVLSALGFLSSKIISGSNELDYYYGGVLQNLECSMLHHRLVGSQCLSAAWDEIKDRKGKVIGGTFVKEADLS